MVISLVLLNGEGNSSFLWIVPLEAKNIFTIMYIRGVFGMTNRNVMKGKWTKRDKGNVNKKEGQNKGMRNEWYHLYERNSFNPII